MIQLKNFNFLKFCFIQKIRRRSLDDVAFAEFDCNFNFILAGSNPVKKIQFLFLIVIYLKN
jgi:hypothetical protein